MINLKKKTENFSLPEFLTHLKVDLINDQDASFDKIICMASMRIKKGNF